MGSVVGVYGDLQAIGAFTNARILLRRPLGGMRTWVCKTRSRFYLSTRSSENSYSRHSGEAFSTVPHQPNLGHIGARRPTLEDAPTPPALCPANACSTPMHGTRLLEGLLLTYC